MKASLLSFFIFFYLLAQGQQPNFHELLHIFKTINDSTFITQPPAAISQLGFHTIRSSTNNILSFQNDEGDYLYVIKKRKKIIALKCSSARDSTFAEWVRTLIIDGYKLTRQYVKGSDPYSLYVKDVFGVTVHKQYNSSPQIEYSLEIKQLTKDSHWYPL